MIRDYKKIVAWQRKVGERYHYMAEFEEDGFDTVWARVLKEVKGKRLHISFDVDAVDPSYVPGVSNPDPGGFTSAQAIRMVREVRDRLAADPWLNSDFCREAESLPVGGWQPSRS